MGNQSVKQMMIRCPLVVVWFCKTASLCLCHASPIIKAKLAQTAMFDAPALAVSLKTRCTAPLGFVGSNWWLFEADLSTVPEFQSGLSKTWRRRVSGGSSWQTATCHCLRTWFGRTCKRRKEVTFDGWTHLYVQCKRHVTWACVLGWGVWRYGGWDGAVAFFLHWSSLRGTTCLINVSWIFKTNKLFAHINNFKQFMVCFLHLVNTLLSSLLVYKGEGLPADFRALAWWTLTSFKDSPLWWEPPVKHSLKLCPLNGAQKNHGFCRTNINRRVKHVIS